MIHVKRLTCCNRIQPMAHSLLTHRSFSGFRFEVARCYSSVGLPNPSLTTKNLMKQIEVLQSSDLGENGDVVRAVVSRRTFLGYHCRVCS